MTITAPTAATRPGRWLSVLLIVLGAIGIVSSVGGGVVRGFAAHGATSATHSADAVGVDELRIDSAASAFEIRFDDIDQARLDVTASGGPAQDWRLQRVGATLVAEREPGWRWGWFGNGIMFGDRNGEELVVLTLPSALEDAALDLRADVAAGSFTAEGDWGETTIDLSAGNVSLAGSAASLGVQVSAGEARLDVASAGVIDLDVSAGRVYGSITGEQPTSIDARVSAGNIDLTIPDGEYSVSENVSAGDSEVRVVDNPNAASTIDVRVSAGSVSLVGSAR